MHATRLNTYASVCEEVRNIMQIRATLMSTAHPMDIGALDKEKGKEKGKDKKVTMAKARAKDHKQGAGSPRRNATDRKRDCCKRIHPQENGQEALAEDEVLPGGDAYDEQENSWILMLGPGLIA